MSNGKVLVIKRDANLPMEGEKQYLVCLNGENKDLLYYIKDDRIVMGRSQSADITISDNKMSREHAEFKKSGNEIYLTDLGSQNGIIVNNKKISQKKLEENDEIIIGTTVFQYKIAGKKKVKIEGISEGVQTKTNISSPKKKKPILLIVVVLGGLLLLVDGEKEEKKSDNRINLEMTMAQSTEENLERLIRNKRFEEDRAISNKLEEIFQRGLRELREKNYYRAIEEFNLALNLSPRNNTAQFYLSKTRTSLAKEIDANFKSAIRAKHAYRLQAAIVSYCNVIRLIQNNPDDPRYIKSQKEIHQLEEVLGMEKDEVKCVQKQRTY